MRQSLQDEDRAWWGFWQCTERGLEWMGLVGTVNPQFRPAPEAFRGMGAKECARRLRELVVEEFGGAMVRSPYYFVDFFNRRIELRFWVALPFSSENSWSVEGRGLTRVEYAD